MFEAKSKTWKKMGIDTEMNFKEICENLDKQHKEYLNGELKTFTGEEILENFLSRKNTFLTNK